MKWAFLCRLPSVILRWSSLSFHFRAFSAIGHRRISLRHRQRFLSSKSMLSSTCQLDDRSQLVSSWEWNRKLVLFCTSRQHHKKEAWAPAWKCAKITAEAMADCSVINKDRCSSDDRPPNYALRSAWCVRLAKCAEKVDVDQQCFFLWVSWCGGLCGVSPNIRTNKNLTRLFDMAWTSTKHIGT